VQVNSSGDASGYINEVCGSKFGREIVSHPPRQFLISLVCLSAITLFLHVFLLFHFALSSSLFIYCHFILCSLLSFCFSRWFVSSIRRFPLRSVSYLPKAISEHAGDKLHALQL
jgi:hypothetical protein